MSSFLVSMYIHNYLEVMSFSDTDDQALRLTPYPNIPCLYLALYSLSQAGRANGHMVRAQEGSLSPP